MKIPAIIALLLLLGCAEEDSYPCEAGTIKIPVEQGIPTVYECDDVGRCQGPIPWEMDLGAELTVYCDNETTVTVEWM